MIYSLKRWVGPLMGVVTHGASYHGGCEGDVVDERGGQSRNPHHQDNGYGQALVLGNGLRGQGRRGPFIPAQMQVD